MSDTPRMDAAEKEAEEALKAYRSGLDHSDGALAKVIILVTRILITAGRKLEREAPRAECAPLGATITAIMTSR